jgi:hypothetical protein
VQAYVEALAQAQREPQLRAQLAAHMREVRQMVAERVAESLGGAVPVDDPRCQAAASFVMAVCDGLALQWLLSPDETASGEQLLSGLAMVFAASFGRSPAGESVSDSARR